MTLKAEGKPLAAFVIGAKSAGAVEVLVDDRPIGVYSTKSPLAANQPNRLLKHIVLWSSSADLATARHSICLRRAGPKVTPIVQNLFVWNDWRGPSPDDALVAVLLEH